MYETFDDARKKFIHKLKNGINEYKDVLYSNLEEKQVLDEKKNIKRLEKYRKRFSN